MSNYKNKADATGRSRGEHRIIMEELLGRELVPDEVVHHIDHDPSNNDPENLMVMSRAEHASHHNGRHSRTKVCEVCGDDYEPHPTKRGRARTCSRECMKALMSQLATERHAPSVAARPWITCQVCGAQFQVARSRAGTAKFCGRACAGEARRLPR